MRHGMRVLRGAVTVGALAVIGGGLRWVTVGSAGAAMTEDLASMAGLAVAAVAWVTYGWLVVAFLATALEQAPGAIGTSATAIASWTTSQGSRALLRSALGVAAVSPLTIAAAYANPADSGPHASVRHTSSAWTEVERASAVRLGPPPVQSRSQVDSQGQQPGEQPGKERWADVEPASIVRLTGITPEERRPVARPGRAAVGPDERPAVARRVGVPDRPTDGAPTRYTALGSGRQVRPVDPASSSRHRVVRRGDSLWAIAAAELGPGAPDAAIAARWPEWYAANAPVIGTDPEFLLPGQVLRAPDHGTSRPRQSTPEEK